MTRHPIQSTWAVTGRRAIRIAALALTFCLLAWPVLGSAQHDGPSNTNVPDRPAITVTGQGTVSATPDMAGFTAGVEVSAADLTTAQNDASNRMTQILDALRQAGVPEQAIQTAGFRVEVIRIEDAAPQPADAASVSDVSAAPAATPGPPAALGFRVVNEVRVEVHEIARLGSILDAVIAAGANRVSGVVLSVQDRSSVEQQARQRAFDAAQTKAEELALAAGLQLGEVLLIVSEDASSPQPVVAEAQAAGGSVPIAAGQNDITVTVQVTFALLPDDETAQATPAA